MLLELWNDKKEKCQKRKNAVCKIFIKPEINFDDIGEAHLQIYLYLNILIFFNKSKSVNFTTMEAFINDLPRNPHLVGLNNFDSFELAQFRLTWGVREADAILRKMNFNP